MGRIWEKVEWKHWDNYATKQLLVFDTSHAFAILDKQLEGWYCKIEVALTSFKIGK